MTVFCLPRNTDKKAAIGYTYEDSTHVMEDEQGCVVSEEEDEESSDTDVETADLGIIFLCFWFAFVVLL